MIAHVVLIALRPGLTERDREQIAADVSAAYLVIVECDTLDDLKAYLVHPAHAAIGKHFTESSSAALAYDFELTDE